MSFLYLEQSWIPNHQAIVSLLESLFNAVCGSRIIDTCPESAATRNGAHE